MKKRNTRHEKRLKRLIVTCLLCAIILTVSTYAWFIGMQTVSVNAFQVNVAAADGLALSLDGESFSETVTINSTTDLSDEYPTNTNKWTSLEPISTVGKINTDYSRMIIYEKSSLTASKGGYRLMSKVLNNTTREDEKEADGYVVFDLFVKNLSGEAYYTESNPLNEEAVYLTPESNVSVGTSGVKNTGIENSVRVAFAQIGRVKSDKSAAVAQGITCETKGDVTGVCAEKDAVIWEPNDKAHIQNAISWYDESCKLRTGNDVTKEASYAGDCTTISDGNFYQTYAVGKEITEDDNVDVYDGEEYNTYETTITNGLLVGVDTLTDTEKMYVGAERPTFMTLAPNSITKVRVYVYIEGQDVDNYDFASLGKQISVEFGFTKERYYGEDFGYDNNPELPEDSYRYDYETYTATGEVKGLPTGVTYEAPDTGNGETEGTMKIHKAENLTTFEFKDGETTMVATLSESGTKGKEDYKRTWSFAEKE